MAGDHDWTTEAVMQLRAFWTEGHATAEIGRRLGVSKNAVIGKARRLGLPGRPSPIRGKTTGKTPRKQALPPALGPNLPPPQRPAADRAPPPRPSPPAIPVPCTAPAPPEPAAPVCSAVSALARPVGHQPCCWPIGHPGRPGFRFCAADAMPRKPYCAEHAGTAYVAPETARDRASETASRFVRDRRGLTRTP